MSAANSFFAQYEQRGYPYRFAGRIHVDVLAGGIPTNPDVAAAWIKASGYKGADLKNELLRSQVAEVMAERGVGEAEAIDEVAKNRHLKGFKRVPTLVEAEARRARAREAGVSYRDDIGLPDHAGELYIEGRQLKSALKEAASAAADAGKLKPRGFGQTNSRKGIVSFMAEHVFVVERRLYLNVHEPSDVEQRFVHTFRGDGIQYTEIAEDVTFDFTVETDHDFSEEEWAMLWLTGQREGIGAERSQGYGRYTVVSWESVAAPASRRRRAAKTTEEAAETPATATAAAAPEDAPAEPVEAPEVPVAEEAEPDEALASDSLTAAIGSMARR